MGEPTSTPVKRSGGRRKGPDLGALIDTTIVGLFGLVAVATAHEHWLKEREEIAAISGPLNAWVDQLPAKTLKKVEENLTPVLLVVGLATVVGPDVAMEMRLRNESKNARTAFPQSPIGAGFRGSHAASDSPPEMARNGASATGREGGWTAGIPAVPHIGSEQDF